jgi:hypothetical protein
MNHFSRHIKLLNGTILTLALVLPMAATAAPVYATSYSYTNSTPAGEAGYSSYDDPGLTKLTDSNTGSTTPGDGTWVGWQTVGADQITFVFASSVTITNVALDFLRDDLANTQLPLSVTIDGTAFPTTDFATDNTQGFVSYAGSFTGSSLVITLNHPTSNWTFLNEAQFTAGSTSSVPEPASLILVGTTLGGLMLGRKRFHRRKVA